MSPTTPGDKQMVLTTEQRIVRTIVTTVVNIQRDGDQIISVRLSTTDGNFDETIGGELLRKLDLPADLCIGDMVPLSIAFDILGQPEES